MDGFSDIFNGVERELNNRMDTVTKDNIDLINLAAQEQTEKIQALLSTGAKLQVQSPNGVKVLTGLKHKQLQDLIKIVSQRMPVLIVGMAGTGKTHAAEQAAEALKIPFYAMSVGAQTSKSDIIGYMSANGTYVPTLFRKAYEEGGVFLMDEIDAGNANVLIQVNAALSNNYCAFPDGMVKRHKDFSFIATANTYGNGANRMYVGRNQLDAATLDRFTVLDWQVDETLEAQLVANSDQGERWHLAVKNARQYVHDQQLRVLITPRATLRGVQLLETGFELEQVMEAAILTSVPSDKQSVLKDRMLHEWNSYTPKSKPKQLTPAEQSKADKTRMRKKTQSVEAEIVEIDKIIADFPF
jgi:hypothetical protein